MKRTYRFSCLVKAVVLWLIIPTVILSPDASIEICEIETRDVSPTSYPVTAKIQYPLGVPAWILKSCSVPGCNITWFWINFPVIIGDKLLYISEKIPISWE